MQNESDHHEDRTEHDARADAAPPTAKPQSGSAREGTPSRPKRPRRRLDRRGLERVLRWSLEENARQRTHLLAALEILGLDPPGDATDG